MEKRRIQADELAIGSVLPWDAFDDRGRLLLRKGEVVSRSSQIEGLISRGLFIEHLEPRRARFMPYRAGPSAVSPILEARRRLELLCAPEALREGWAEHVLYLRELVAEACKVSQDAALATALFERQERYSIRHSIDVAVACHIVGTELEMDPDVLTSTVAAALTMNMSILELQDQLQAQKEPLSDLQREVIQRHPEETTTLLRAYGVTDKVWLQAVLCHHEALDGSGYGQGIAGDEISLPAQLVSLGDVYCARISSRKYRRALRPNAALKALFLDQGKKVSQDLAGHFIKAIGVFPAGSPVRLANGEIAVVTQRGEKATTPHVCSIIGPHGMPLMKPIERKTSTPGYSVREVMEWSQVGAMPTMHALWGKLAAVE